ncbi:MAG: hypothetical protein NWE92_06010 [Candidatus Bathyarchaeota archaeon]|nr:hypothetical protein [Candidatus Bathyarchaeota archaeon]
MRDRYQETLQHAKEEQQKLEATMRSHPNTQEHDDQLQIQLQWLNKQEK